ncbi:hypothetical protein ULG90_16485 [Halopseudomonas pachastrellae]|nr:hypothetical protein ULG90_16485 [Halopseudomonas pachastrellae]
MTTATTPEYGLKELQLETTFGGMGKETVRDIPLIDLMILRTAAARSPISCGAPRLKSASSSWSTMVWT